MTCQECQAPMKQEAIRPVPYTMAGLPHVILRGAIVRRCPNGHTETAIPRIAQLNRVLAGVLVRKTSPLAKEEIRFLRQHLGYSQSDFAKHMGVAPESVSRWESGSVRMAATAERLLRLMVVTQAPIANYSLDVLTKLKGAPRQADVKLKSTETDWLLAA